MISIEDPFGEAMVGQRLAHYLSARFERHTTIESVKRFTVGFSWMTYGFVAVYSDADGLQRQRLVLRIGPPTGLFAPYVASHEFTLLQALLGHGVPIPKVFFYSDDSEEFGAPFFISQHMSGVAPLPWIAPGTEAFPSDIRQKLSHQFVQSLAALHNFEWQRTPVRDLAKQVNIDNTAAQQLDYWEKSLRRWQLRVYPVVEQAVVWLSANCPVAPKIVIVHGDYRIGNFLVDGEEITAILDWELVHMGDPHEDLAFMSLRAFGGKALDGRFLACHLLTREELYAQYTQATGTTVQVGAIRFYELFNIFKLFVIHVGAIRCFEDGQFTDLRMPAMGAQVPRLLLQLQKSLDEAVA